VIGENEAILSGIQGEWKPPEDSLPNLWMDNKMVLPDFRHLACYLARSSARGDEVSETLQVTAGVRSKAEGDGNA
jgi:hypothetical protein